MGQEILGDEWVVNSVGIEVVGGQEHVPIGSRYFSGFFVLSVQVLVPSRGQEHVPIVEKDKNMFRLPLSSNSLSPGRMIQ